MAATKLTTKLRAEVVARFAQWEGSSQIRRWLREEHGIQVQPSALTVYNFDNPESRRTGTPRWVELFDEVRAAARTELADIPTAHKAVRMRIRDREIMRIARSERVNVTQLNELLEAQAKEDGGMFTNRRELTGAAGGPIQTEDVGLSDAERADRIAALLERAGTRRAGQPSEAPPA